MPELNKFVLPGTENLGEDQKSSPSSIVNPINNKPITNIPEQHTVVSDLHEAATQAATVHKEEETPSVYDQIKNAGTVLCMVDNDQEEPMRISEWGVITVKSATHANDTVLTITNGLIDPDRPEAYKTADYKMKELEFQTRAKENREKFKRSKEVQELANKAKEDYIEPKNKTTWMSLLCSGLWSTLEHSVGYDRKSGTFTAPGYQIWNKGRYLDADLKDQIDKYWYETGFYHSKMYWASREEFQQAYREDPESAINKLLEADLTDAEREYYAYEMVTGEIYSDDNVVTQTIANTLINLGASMDWLANPVKASVMWIEARDGKTWTTRDDKYNLQDKSFLDTLGSCYAAAWQNEGLGRIQYDYDTGCIPLDMVLEFLSDPEGLVTAARAGLESHTLSKLVKQVTDETDVRIKLGTSNKAYWDLAEDKADALISPARLKTMIRTGDVEGIIKLFPEETQSAVRHILSDMSEYSKYMDAEKTLGKFLNWKQDVDQAFLAPYLLPFKTVWYIAEETVKGIKFVVNATGAKLFADTVTDLMTSYHMDGVKLNVIPELIDKYNVKVATLNSMYQTELKMLTDDEKLSIIRKAYLEEKISIRSASGFKSVDELDEATAKLLRTYGLTDNTFYKSITTSYVEYKSMSIALSATEVPETIAENHAKLKALIDNEEVAITVKTLTLPMDSTNITQSFKINSELEADTLLDNKTYTDMLGTLEVDGPAKSTMIARANSATPWPLKDRENRAIKKICATRTKTKNYMYLSDVLAKDSANFTKEERRWLKDYLFNVGFSNKCKYIDVVDMADSEIKSKARYLAQEWVKGSMKFQDIYEGSRYVDFSYLGNIYDFDVLKEVGAKYISPELLDNKIPMYYTIRDYGNKVTIHFDDGKSFTLLSDANSTARCYELDKYIREMDPKIQLIGFNTHASGYDTDALVRQICYKNHSIARNAFFNTIDVADLIRKADGKPLITEAMMNEAESMMYTCLKNQQSDSIDFKTFHTTFGLTPPNRKEWDEIMDDLSMITDKRIIPLTKEESEAIKKVDGYIVSATNTEAQTKIHKNASWIEEYSEGTIDGTYKEVYGMTEDGHSYFTSVPRVEAGDIPLVETSKKVTKIPVMDYDKMLANAWYHTNKTNLREEVDLFVKHFAESGGNPVKISYKDQQKLYTLGFALGVFPQEIETAEEMMLWMKTPRRANLGGHDNPNSYLLDLFNALRGNGMKFTDLQETSDNIYNLLHSYLYGFDYEEVVKQGRKDMTNVKGWRPTDTEGASKTVTEKKHSQKHIRPWLSEEQQQFIGKSNGEPGIRIDIKGIEKNKAKTSVKRIHDTYRADKEVRAAAEDALLHALRDPCTFNYACGKEGMLRQIQMLAKSYGIDIPDDVKQLRDAKPIARNKAGATGTHHVKLTHEVIQQSVEGSNDIKYIFINRSDSYYDQLCEAMSKKHGVAIDPDNRFNPFSKEVLHSDIDDILKNTDFSEIDAELNIDKIIDDVVSQAEEVEEVKPVVEIVEGEDLGVVNKDITFGTREEFDDIEISHTEYAEGITEPMRAVGYKVQPRVFTPEEKDVYDMLVSLRDTANEARQDISKAYISIYSQTGFDATTDFDYARALFDATNGAITMSKLWDSTIAKEWLPDFVIAEHDKAYIRDYYNVLKKLDAGKKSLKAECKLIPDDIVDAMYYDVCNNIWEVAAARLDDSEWKVWHDVIQRSRSLTKEQKISIIVNKPMIPGHYVFGKTERMIINPDGTSSVVTRSHIDKYHLENQTVAAFFARRDNLIVGNKRYYNPYEFAPGVFGSTHNAWHDVNEVVHTLNEVERGNNVLTKKLQIIEGLKKHESRYRYEYSKSKVFEILKDHVMSMGVAESETMNWFELINHNYKEGLYHPTTVIKELEDQSYSIVKSIMEYSPEQFNKVMYNANNRLVISKNVFRNELDLAKMRQFANSANETLSSEFSKIDVIEVDDAFVFKRTSTLDAATEKELMSKLNLPYVFTVSDTKSVSRTALLYEELCREDSYIFDANFTHTSGLPNTSKISTAVYSKYFPDDVDPGMCSGPWFASYIGSADALVESGADLRLSKDAAVNLVNGYSRALRKQNGVVDELAIAFNSQPSARTLLSDAARYGLSWSDLQEEGYRCVEFVKDKNGRVFVESSSPLRKNARIFSYEEYNYLSNIAADYNKEISSGLTDMESAYLSEMDKVRQAYIKMYLYTNPSTWMRNWVDSSVKAASVEGLTHYDYLALSREVVPEYKEAWVAINEFVKEHPTYQFEDAIDYFWKHVDEFRDTPFVFLNKDMYKAMDNFENSSLSVHLTEALKLNATPEERMNALFEFNKNHFDDCETHNRIAILLKEMDEGHTFSQALNQIDKTQFNYGNNGRFKSVSKILPFINFRTRNYGFWLTPKNVNGRLASNLAKLYTRDLGDTDYERNYWSEEAMTARAWIKTLPVDHDDSDSWKPPVYRDYDDYRGSSSYSALSQGWIMFGDKLYLKFGLSFTDALTGVVGFFGDITGGFQKRMVDKERYETNPYESITGNIFTPITNLIEWIIYGNDFNNTDMSTGNYMNKYGFDITSMIPGIGTLLYRLILSDRGRVAGDMYNLTNTEHLFLTAFPGLIAMQKQWVDTGAEKYLRREVGLKWDDLTEEEKDNYRFVYGVSRTPKWTLKNPTTYVDTWGRMRAMGFTNEELAEIMNDANGFWVTPEDNQAHNFTLMQGEWATQMLEQNEQFKKDNPWTALPKYQSEKSKEWELKLHTLQVNSQELWQKLKDDLVSYGWTESEADLWLKECAKPTWEISPYKARETYEGRSNGYHSLSGLYGAPTQRERHPNQWRLSDSLGLRRQQTVRGARIERTRSEKLNGVYWHKRQRDIYKDNYAKYGASRMAMNQNLKAYSNRSIVELHRSEQKIRYGQIHRHTKWFA